VLAGVAGSVLWARGKGLDKSGNLAGRALNISLLGRAGKIARVAAAALLLALGRCAVSLGARVALAPALVLEVLATALKVLDLVGWDVLRRQQHAAACQIALEQPQLAAVAVEPGARSEVWGVHGHTLRMLRPRWRQELDAPD